MSISSPRYEVNPYHASVAKRGVDIALATASAPVLLPVAGMAAKVLRKKLDEGSILFRQERVGGTITKFRTMLHAAPGEAEVAASVWEASNVEDPRVVAPKIKNNRIDETPQVALAFCDALRPGRRSQSVVSLRPLVASHADDYYDIVKGDDPQMAEFWRYELLPNVQHGAISMASVVHSRRTSNDGTHMAQFHELSQDPSEELQQRLFATSWVQYDVKYNADASVTTDLMLAAKAAYEVGNIVIAGAIKPQQA